jgi:hypothetical protein
MGSWSALFFLRSRAQAGAAAVAEHEFDLENNALRPVFPAADQVVQGAHGLDAGLAGRGGPTMARSSGTASPQAAWRPTRTSATMRRET